MAKVMISMPDEMLAAIDEEARQRDQTRSGLMREAAAGLLGWPSDRAMEVALKRARDAVALAGPFESAGVVRGVRDERDRHDRGR